jgi:vancomycin resistance protein YoaR
MSVGKSDYLLLVALVFFLGLLYVVISPHSREISRVSYSLDGLSSAQKSNIALAASEIDGLVLKPGDGFSFNQQVGPRTIERGYLECPSYLEGVNTQTTGGGICLVSSALYQLFLGGDLDVSERHAHTKKTLLVQPGQDATVWYGGADLKVKNNQSYPLAIKTFCNGKTLVVSLNSDLWPRSYPKAELSARVINRSNNKLTVETYQQFSSKSKLVSRDVYSF